MGVQWVYSWVWSIVEVKKTDLPQGEPRLIFVMAFCIVIWELWDIEKNGLKALV